MSRVPSLPSSQETFGLGARTKVLAGAKVRTQAPLLAPAVRRRQLSLSARLPFYHLPESDNTASFPTSNQTLDFS